MERIHGDSYRRVSLGLLKILRHEGRPSAGGDGEAAKKPFVEGSTGPLTEHPGSKGAARCDEFTLRLYREPTAGPERKTRPNRAAAA